MITLAIIGVVVAMTIPSLMYRHKQITTVNKVKNFYSKMNNLMVHVIQNNTELKYLEHTDWNTNGKKSSEELWSYFKPYLSVAKDCGTTANSDCISSGVYKLNGQYHNNYNNANFYKMKLKDGGSMWVLGGSGKDACSGTDAGTTNVCGLIFYDVNGTKGPNTWGRDVFYFAVKSNEIVPAQNNDCNKNSNGLGCANYILLHENMDYLK